MKTLLPPLIFFVCFSFQLTAQQEITLLNGTVFNADKITVDSNWVSFDYLNKKGRLKQKMYPRGDIFSIKYADGRESVLYMDDADTSVFLGVTEMRYYVEGAKTARANYNGTKHFIFGATVGVASGLALNSFLFGVAVPPVYTVLTTMLPVNIKKLPQNQYGPEFYYKQGAKKHRKKLRTSTSLISSAAGVIVGLATAGIILK